jgi:hypothetical protein
MAVQAFHVLVHQLTYVGISKSARYTHDLVIDLFPKTGGFDGISGP